MRKRRQYFIDKGFQTRFILIFCLLAVIWTLLTSAVFYYLINNRLESAYYSSHLNFTTTGEIIAPVLFKVNFIAVAIISVLALLTALFYIKRVEDNFIKFKDAAAKVTGGDLTVAMPQINMDGTMSNLSDNFNAMTAIIRKGIASISDSVDVLDAKARGLDSILKDSLVSDDKIKDAAKNIKGALTKVKEKAARFKVC